MGERDGGRRGKLASSLCLRCVVSPPFAPSRKLIDPLPVPSAPSPPNRVRLRGHERQVAQVEALKELDDGAPGLLQEAEDHFFFFFALLLVGVAGGEEDVLIALFLPKNSGKREETARSFRSPAPLYALLLSRAEAQARLERRATTRVRRDRNLRRERERQEKERFFEVVSSEHKKKGIIASFSFSFSIALVCIFFAYEKNRNQITKAKFTHCEGSILGR